MRFKGSLETFVLILVAIYILHLGFTGDLNLYIHPRYVVFTYVMAFLGLIVLAVHHLFYSSEKQHSHGTKLRTMLPLALVVGFALFTPARPLTSATVTQRSTDASSLVTTVNSQPVSTLFAGSSRGLKLEDWSRSLAVNTDPDFYQNRPARVSGFIYDAGLGPDTLWVARFVVTCCAVDAQPIGVPVHVEDWQSSFEEDQWIEVEGGFELRSTAEGEQLVLQPMSVNEIDIPSNPYAN